MAAEDATRELDSNVECWETHREHYLSSKPCCGHRLIQLGGPQFNKEIFSLSIGCVKTFHLFNYRKSSAALDDSKLRLEGDEDVSNF